MKKIIGVLMISFLGLLSCKKDYVCSYQVNGFDTKIEYDGLTTNQADSFKGNCDKLNGVWSIK